jgi:hypothetical protein
MELAFVREGVVLRISRELSCDVPCAPSYKGFAKTGQQLMLAQTVKPGIQSVVYDYESSFMYINRDLSSGDLSFSPCLSILVNTAYHSLSS